MRGRRPLPRRMLEPLVPRVVRHLVPRVCHPVRPLLRLLMPPYVRLCEYDFSSAGFAAERAKRDGGISTPPEMRVAAPRPRAPFARRGAAPNRPRPRRTAGARLRRCPARPPPWRRPPSAPATRCCASATVGCALSLTPVDTVTVTSALATRSSAFIAATRGRKPFFVINVSPEIE